MKFVGDFHIHTVASGDAFSTIDEITESAIRKNLKIIAITDHGPAMPASAHRYFFKSLAKNINGTDELKILPGVEANIIDLDGNLDLPYETIASLSFVIISYHTFSWNRNDIESNTKALINCINKYPNIKAIAHINHPLYELDYIKIAHILKEKKIAIELNNNAIKSDKRLSKFKEIILKMKGLGVRFVVNSDAHSSKQVGEFDKSIEFINYCNLHEEDLVNTSLEGIRDMWDIRI